MEKKITGLMIALILMTFITGVLGGYLLRDQIFKDQPKSPITEEPKADIYTKLTKGDYSDLIGIYANVKTGKQDFQMLSDGTVIIDNLNCIRQEEPKQELDGIISWKCLKENSVKGSLVFIYPVGVKVFDGINYLEEDTSKIRVAVSDGYPTSDSYSYKEDSIDNKPIDQEMAIGEITDQLLATHTTYSYMNGTYLKGKVINNYLWYNGFIWRIMGKNENGSIRLITESPIASVMMGASGDNADIRYQNSYVKDWINHYFMPSLKSDKKIVSTKFCEDDTVISSSLPDNEKTARETCEKSNYAQAGILTLDEYNLSGAYYGYLQNTLSYWTSTSSSATSYWTVVNAVSLSTNYAWIPSGLRVVLSIDANTKVSSGDGRLIGSNTAYIIKNISESNQLKEKATVGEYVSFDGHLYRILEQNNTETKLILDGYFKEKTIYGESFQSISNKLKSSELLSWLAPKRQNELLDISWYRGNYFSYGGDYKELFSSKENEYKGKIGISRMSELFSSQSLSILTKNYETDIDYKNAQSFWTSTAENDTMAWFINGLGNSASIKFPTFIRPIIAVSSTKNIQSGVGTLSSPYEI